jgi:membrane-bound lytic murein transglycosylase D
MTKIFISLCLMLCCLWTPLAAGAAQELHDVRHAEHTSSIYDRAIVFFAEKIPETFKVRLENSYHYIDMVKGIFSEKGIPAEIAYLPMIESGYSPWSIGPGGTAGLWQFVRSTARSYGLRIDRYVDERKDPVKSTYAAAAYLRDLYSMFGSWDLTLIAYNAGAGKLRGVSDIYTARGFSPITKRYVPYLMAAYTIANDPERYGIETDGPEPEKKKAHREIVTDSSIHLATIAKKHSTTVKEIRNLNPALQTGKTPPYRYTIRVPSH